MAVCNLLQHAALECEGKSKNVCGKEGIWNKKIRDHIEANHITGISIQYDLRGKSCKSRNGLANHKSKYHRSDHWTMFSEHYICQFQNPIIILLSWFLFETFHFWVLINKLLNFASSFSSYITISKRYIYHSHPAEVVDGYLVIWEI